MDPRFQYCFNVLMGNEGGTSNNPADHGGLTQAGVTQSTYDAYRTSKGLPLQPVTRITAAELNDLYYTNYWTLAHAGQMPAPVDLCVFDTAVNSGPGRAIKLLQLALGFTDDAVDGAFGPGTMAAMMQTTATTLAGAYCDQRELFVRGLVTAQPGQGIFLQGWLNRINHIRALCAVTTSN